MTNTLSRRDFLAGSVKTSLGLAALSSAITLSGCSSPVATGAGFRALREKDLPFFSAVIPTTLGIPSLTESRANATALTNLDDFLFHTHPEVVKLTRQLLDVLIFPPTRSLLTGCWSDWEDASPEQVDQALNRLRHSSLGILQMGYAALIQLIQLSWYRQPESWAHTGYPGPPAKIPFHS